MPFLTFFFLRIIFCNGGQQNRGVDDGEATRRSYRQLLGQAVEARRGEGQQYQVARERRRQRHTAVNMATDGGGALWGWVEGSWNGGRMMQQQAAGTVEGGRSG